MKLLLVSASFDRSHGGPAYSVPTLGAALARAGATVGLWCADGATPPERPGDAALLGGTLDEAIAAFGRPDLIHDNGIWLPHNHRLAGLARRLDIPRVVSLRGMLEPWAFNHKWLKKRIAWHLYQRADLRSASLLHATSEAEERNARARGLDGPYCMIANGMDLPAGAPRLPRAPGAPRTALFLGRVYPVKGLPMLVDAWARVRPAGWELVIAGPDEAGHAAEVAARIAAHGLGGTVRLRGPVWNGEKRALLRSADLFVLPSYSENFGIAAAEALAHGLPVIATTGAPWQLLEEHRCGWWVAPEAEAIATAIAAATSASDAERAAMGDRGTALIAERFRWDGIAARFLAQYRALTTRDLGES
ncbi:glycosyltransferase [Sphingomonas canadensis]|uniref:Glycosyltransferase n=1 Tax=Sphingomonas canadensis TaxID=1219257 RepID=A0ABW3H7M1_9SPHN|nr:glycosyltransferase [Sphingomonas canadensis]MCW3835402.1 glycosyltransferase [Sphingomonas canadensis]